MPHLIGRDAVESSLRPRSSRTRDETLPWRASRMVRLFYSNRTEELFDELAVRVRKQQLRDGPLVPVSIVVPSATVDARVRLALARACGIAANLDIALLMRFATDLLRRTNGIFVADSSSLQAMALAQILDPRVLASPEFAPVCTYLHGGGDAVDPIDLRRVQLASRVGRLFEQYSYSRGDLLAAWLDGLALGPAGGETERWQRRMWLGMFGPDGIAGRRASAGQGQIVPLCGAVDAFDPVPDVLPPAVHVVLFPHFARAFHVLFERLARFTEVCIYALSPCEGFWEDTDSRDPEPLVLWGRPGREQMRALNAMSGFDHDDRFVDPLTGDGAARTLLHRLQSDVLRRQPLGAEPPGRADRDGDGSIVVLEHASIRRELEAVASEIWRLCEVDERLRFDDVAVLVPEADEAEYAAQVPTVFREAHDLPHRLLTGTMGGTDAVVDAIDLLLSLPVGRFTRESVLRVAIHPLVVASMEDVNPESWIAWCDALGVVHGADRADHEGTYIARDILNWDQGLRRLALGSFMAEDTTGDWRPFDVGGQSYLPYETLPSDMHDAAAFGVLVQSLLADARFARDSELTLAEWASFLRALIETYIAPTTSSEEERLAGCLRRVVEFGRMDIGGVRVRYRIACELLRQRLSSVGDRAAQGVVVSTLTRMRSLPFGIVFVCGMSEGRFPTPEAEDPLDLRWARRHEGDVTARERDRYAFLELLLGTRDRLFLSYVSRDAVTGDVLAPSSVVQELLHVLGRDYGVDVSTLRRRHPLRRWDRGYFPDLYPDRSSTDSVLGTMSIDEARAEARTLAMRLNAEACGSRVRLEDIATRASDQAPWAALADHLGLSVLPSEEPPAEPRIVIPAYAVVKFLECPVQGWARFRLGLDELEEDDVMGREDEPFETPGRDETLLLRGVLFDAASTGRAVEVVYDAEVRHRELRGMGPSGVFARGERRDHLATLDGWTREMAASGVAVEAIEFHRFGRGGERARADRVHEALHIDVDVTDRAGLLRLVRVEIGGRTLPLGGDADTSLLLLRRRKDDAKKDEWVRAERDRLAIRAFVDHALLSASGVAAPRSRSSLVVLAMPDGTAITDRVWFAPLSRDEATVWLRDTIRQLISRSHAYFFPCEAVFARALRDPAGPVTPWIEMARDRLGDDDDRSALRSSYGPVPRLYGYAAPDEASARELIATRFGLLLERRRAER
jgi:exodeoxyribonuclease V gamma subunit